MICYISMHCISFLEYSYSDFSIQSPKSYEKKQINLSKFPSFRLESEQTLDSKAHTLFESNFETANLKHRFRAVKGPLKESLIESLSLLARLIDKINLLFENL